MCIGKWHLGNYGNIAADHPEALADIAQEVQRHRATVTPVKSQLEETIKSN